MLNQLTTHKMLQKKKLNKTYDMLNNYLYTTTK